MNVVTVEALHTHTHTHTHTSNFIINKIIKNKDPCYMYRLFYLRI